MGECFKKEGIVYHSEIKSEEKKNVPAAFGSMKAKKNHRGRQEWEADGIGKDSTEGR